MSRAQQETYYGGSRYAVLQIGPEIHIKPQYKVWVGLPTTAGTFVLPVPDSSMLGKTFTILRHNETPGPIIQCRQHDGLLLSVLEDPGPRAADFSLTRAAGGGFLWHVVEYLKFARVANL